VVEGSYHSQARYLSVGISQSDPAKVEPFRRYEIQRDAFLDLLLFDFVLYFGGDEDDGRMRLALVVEVGTERSNNGQQPRDCFGKCRRRQPEKSDSNLSETQDFSKIRGGLSGAGRSSEASRSMMYHQLFRHKR
jgi:hypothetical protein